VKPTLKVRHKNVNDRYDRLVEEMMYAERS